MFEKNPHHEFTICEEYQIKHDIKENQNGEGNHISVFGKLDTNVDPELTDHSMPHTDKAKDGHGYENVFVLKEKKIYQKNFNII